LLDAGLSADSVVVVSGVPRSGTSLMMQVLAAGGVPLLTDDVRQADVHNPRGYFELEAVKAKDAGWVERARGKAVKVVHLLLERLPPQHRYRVILMTRALSEVVASQRAMLASRVPLPGRGAGAALDDSRLERVYAVQLEQVRRWLDEQGHCDVLGVSYNALVADPAPIVSAVAAFVGGALDVEAMARAVDPALYRQRLREG
jgi:LPS sulfotransferase NodH